MSTEAGPPCLTMAPVFETKRVDINIFNTTCEEKLVMAYPFN